MTSPRGLKRSRFDHISDTDLNSSSDYDSINSISFPSLSLSNNSRFPTTSATYSSGSPPKPNTNSFHRFMLVKAPGLVKSLDSVSPFLISRWLLGMVGTTKNVKKLRSGDLLVECASHNQSTKLKNLKFIESGSEKISVTCESHPTLNTSKGVIRSSELRGESDENILAELKEQNVTSVQRLILNKKSDNPTSTNTFF